MEFETSVIIPTLDDAEVLDSVLEGLNSVIVGTGAAVEVLVVDAGSRDTTLDVAGQLAERYPLLHLRLLVQDASYAGIGTVVRLGVAYARGRYCVIVMPDKRVPLRMMPELVEKLRDGADLALISRYEPDSDNAATPQRFKLYQRLYRLVTRLLLNVDIPDSTFGFRAFSRAYVSALGLSSRSFAVFPEITFKVLLSGGAIARVRGSNTTPTLHSQAKFRLNNEVGGYGLVLLRAGLHRRGIRWF